MAAAHLGEVLDEAGVKVGAAQVGVARCAQANKSAEMGFRSDEQWGGVSRKQNLLRAPLTAHESAE
jgi:hypothetical protein